MRKLPILSVVSAGNPDFERFLISDDHGRQWTGQDFSDQGILYAARNQACGDVHTILKGFFQTEPVQYEAPLVIEVYGDADVAKVARYLSKASTLHIGTGKYGNGPGSSLVLPTIEWCRIEEVAE